MEGGGPHLATLLAAQGLLISGRGRAVLCLRRASSALLRLRASGSLLSLPVLPAFTFPPSAGHATLVIIAACAPAATASAQEAQGTKAPPSILQETSFEETESKESDLADSAPILDALEDTATGKQGQPAPSFLTITLNGMIAGAAAGSAVEAALYPIDTIKTRLQAAKAGGGIDFRGLYSGVWGNLAGVIPASAIFVGVYEPLKSRLLKLVPEDLSVTAHLAAGAAAGLAASLVRVPTEVIKQRLQTGQFSSVPSAVRAILAAEGARGLYAGYGSFLLRDLPFDAIQFAIYEQLKTALSKLARRPLRDEELAVVGAAAGAITGAVTTPLDVIKTRLMTQGTTMKYRGILDCVAKISAEEGTAAFFKGVTPRVTWIGIGGFIFFGVLERAKKLLGSGSA